MKPLPIAIQLYSVRDDAAKDLPGVLKKVADLGYAGVEFAGLHGMAPAAVRKILDDLGLSVSSIHGSLPTEENADAIAETAKILGYTRHVSGFGPDRFKTREEVLRVAEQFAQASALMNARGMSFACHNHNFEFDHQFDGLTPHEWMMQEAPGLLAELDTYWIKVGGVSPAAMIRKYGARVPLLHIKDGPADSPKSPMTAVGAGTMNWAEVFSAVTTHTEWLIVEIDRCSTDMWTAVADSCRYLVDNGYAKGRR